MPSSDWFIPLNVTAANLHLHDVTVAFKFIREDDKVVYSDSGYLGLQKRLGVQENAHLSTIDYRISRRPRSLPKMPENIIGWERLIEYRKFSARCNIEYAFCVSKCQFGYTKPGIAG